MRESLNLDTDRVANLEDFAYRFCVVEKLEPPKRSFFTLFLRLFYVGIMGLSALDYRVADLRYRRGMTQVGISIALGVSQPTVSRSLGRAGCRLMSALPLTSSPPGAIPKMADHVY